MKLTIHTDGGARGNPGPAGIGVVYTLGEWSQGYEQYIGHATNNVAEYTAVKEALRLLPEQVVNLSQVKEIHFYLDSQLVVRQITGVYKIKEPSLQQLCLQIKELIRHYQLPVHFNHVPRAENAAADKLVNHALDNA